MNLGDNTLSTLFIIPLVEDIQVWKSPLKSFQVGSTGEE